MNLKENIKSQRQFFFEGNTLDFENRKNKLEKLLKVIQNNEHEILRALNLDFKKSEFEGYMTEIAILYLELKYHISNLRCWMKPIKVQSSILNFHSSEYIKKQPYGLVLIISPWNYPFLLAIQPLISAIAAGNVVLLKPSEITSNTTKIITKIIDEVFEKNWVSVIEGGKEITQEVIKNKFDKIFFTGSTQVGKIIHQAAAQNLTPVVLELGGKSPCVILPSANLKIAANRIVFGKFVNAGQTCIAPDFIWIHESIKDEFLKILVDRIQYCYGNNIENSIDYPRIINKNNFDRLSTLIQKENVFFGGNSNELDYYIEPTILINVTFEDEVMRNEIFGPILPVLSFKNISEIIDHNQKNEKPLAFYVFSENQNEINSLLHNVQFGGGCINDVLSHVINKNLPFGGIGASGMGNYHGKYGFEAFSHSQSIVKKSNWIDISLKYAPYNSKIRILKKFFKFFNI